MRNIQNVQVCDLMINSIKLLWGLHIPIFLQSNTTGSYVCVAVYNIREFLLLSCYVVYIMSKVQFI